MLVENLSQPLPDHMGIDLGRRNVRVSQHKLYAAQVRSPLQQMRGKTVAQHMGSERTANAGFTAVEAKPMPARLAGKGTAPGSDKQVLGGLAPQQLRARGGVKADRLERRAADRDQRSE